MNHNNQNRPVDLVTPATAALAAASKTPFWTAFKITVGIGLARLLLFFVFMGGVIGLITLLGLE